MNDALIRLLLILVAVVTVVTGVTQLAAPAWVLAFIATAPGALGLHFFATVGMPRTNNVVVQVQQGSPAQQAGIEPGDRILMIGDRETPSFEDISNIVLLRVGRTHNARSGTLLASAFDGFRWGGWVGIPRRRAIGGLGRGGCRC